MKQVQNSKLDSLQLCRAVAAMLVVLFHTGGYVEKFYNTKSIFHTGFCGVDFFFVLSGFIISYTSWKLIGNADMAISFAKKRFYRVLPVYWLVILPLLLISVTLPFLINSSYPLSALNLLKTFFVWPNHPRILTISWTLSYEMFFYALFLLVILSKRLFFIPLLIVSGSLVNWCFPGNLTSSPALAFIFNPLNIEFALGVLAFYLTHKIKSDFFQWFTLVGIVLAIISMALIPQESDARIIAFGIPSFLIIIGLVSLEYKKSISVAHPLITLGDASYILYLIHYPVISVSNKLAMKASVFNFVNPIVFNCGVILFTIGLSILLHKKIEKPFLKRLK